MGNKIIQSMALMTAFTFLGANAAEDLDVDLDVDEYKNSRAEVSYFNGQAIPDEMYYKHFSRVVFHEGNPYLGRILVQIAPHHARVAQAFGMNTNGLTNGEYNLRQDPSRIAVSFAQMSFSFDPQVNEENTKLLRLFDKFRQENFGQTQGNLFEYHWAPTQPGAENGDCLTFPIGQCACISFPIAQYENVKTVFDALAGLSTLPDEDRALLTEVYDEILTRTKQLS